MINFLKSKKIFILLIIIMIYFICLLVNQQNKLNSYNKEIAYYNSKIDSLNQTKEELISTQENVNSPEYIEDVAREKLDMYYPNERVYVDISK